MRSRSRVEVRWLGQHLLTIPGVRECLFQEKGLAFLVAEYVPWNDDQDLPLFLERPQFVERWTHCIRSDLVSPRILHGCTTLAVGKWGHMMARWNETGNTFGWFQRGLSGDPYAHFLVVLESSRFRALAQGIVPIVSFRQYYPFGDGARPIVYVRIPSWVRHPKTGRSVRVRATGLPGGIAFLDPRTGVAIVFASLSPDFYHQKTLWRIQSKPETDKCPFGEATPWLIPHCEAAALIRPISHEPNLKETHFPDVYDRCILS